MWRSAGSPDELPSTNGKAALIRLHGNNLTRTAIHIFVRTLPCRGDESEKVACRYGEPPESASARGWQSGLLHIPLHFHV